MSVEENKELALRTFDEVRSKGNIDKIPELFAPDYVAHGAGGEDEIGYEALKQHIARGHSLFPDFQITVEDMVAEGDKIACRGIATGTHLGELMGVAPTGRKMTVSQIGILRFEKSKVVESWGIHDALSMWRQLGIIPPGFESAKPIKEE